MPINLDGQTFDSFEGAVNHVMKKKGLSKDKASAYVGTVDRNENKSAKTILAQLKLSRLKIAFEESEHPRDGGKFTTKDNKKEPRLRGIKDDEERRNLQREYNINHLKKLRDKASTPQDKEYYQRKLDLESIPHDKKTASILLSQLKLARIKLKLADTYNDDNSPDNYQYDTGKVIKKAKDNDEFNLKYDQKELRLGVLYELRFTYNQEEAREKAKKNLNKDSQYYSKMWRDETLVDLTAFDPKRFEQQGSKLSIASGMRLASQNGKYAKYWILNAKDVNGNGWGVSPTTIRQNMASFINKPFVITAKTWIANSEYENQFDHPYISSTDMNQVLNYQEKFRVGNIDNILEDDKNDFYAMISIDDEYRHLPLPPFCSPAIYQQDLSEPEGDITKWGGLHLAGLMENPAYGPRVAILRGSCVGTPNSCLTQFKNQ